MTEIVIDELHQNWRVLSLLGSLPPALRAARLNIIEAVSVE